MLKCLDCGYTFDEDEIKTWREDRGEYWGVPVTERCCGCPRCRGDFEEVDE